MAKQVKPVAQAQPTHGTQKPNKQKKVEHIATIIPEEANDNLALQKAKSLTAGIPHAKDQSSADGKAMLAYVMQQRYANNKDLADKYPEVYEDINRNIDVVTLLALVDIRQDLCNRSSRGELQLELAPDQIMRLQSMSEMLGIKLAPIKALPDKNQLALDFTKSEIPKELNEDAGKTADETPELDPAKITTEEQAKAALQYLIVKEKNVAINLVNTVEWYRVYSINKEENADNKLKLDDKTVGEWLDDIFSKIKVTSLLTGLGRAVYLYCSQTGSPCMSHAILSTHLRKCGWSERQVAETLKALVNENFRYKLESDSKLEPKEDKGLLAIDGNLGNEYITKLMNDANADTSNMANGPDKTELEAARLSARKILGTVRSVYFSKDKTPSNDELRMKIGQIINLYRDPSSQLEEYNQPETLFPKEGEYPETPKKEDVKKKETGLNVSTSDAGKK